MEAGVHFLWPPVHVQINPRSSVFSSFSVMHTLVFSFSAIAENRFGFWYVLPVHKEWESLNFTDLGKKKKSN